MEDEIEVKSSYGSIKARGIIKPLKVGTLGVPGFFEGIENEARFDTVIIVNSRSCSVGPTYITSLQDKKK